MYIDKSASTMENKAVEVVEVVEVMGAVEVVEVMEVMGAACFLLNGATLWKKANHRDMTSYSSTSSDMNTHEHTHACKQAGRWRSSEAARHEDTHTHTYTHNHTTTNPSPLTRNHTITHTILTPTEHPNRSWRFLIVPAGTYPRCNPAPRMTAASSDIPLLQFAHVPVAGGDDTSRPGRAGLCRAPVGKRFWGSDWWSLGSGRSEATPPAVHPAGGTLY